QGAAPETVLVPAGEDPGQAPDPDFREGLRLVLMLTPEFGDAGPRELMSTSYGLWVAVDRLHNAYVAEIARHPGMSPRVVLGDTRESLSPSGSSFEPCFSIVDWVPRPQEFGPEPAPSASPPAQRQAGGVVDDEIPF